jgi:hypothetical protein
MKKERAKQERVSSFCLAGHFARGIPKLKSRIVVQASMAMGAGDDPERAVLVAAIVDVYANGKQLLEKRYRRLYEMLAMLQGPAAELCAFDAIFYGDDQVLVECDKPVPVVGLVEQGALDRDGRRRQRRTDHRMVPDYRH